ncbi:Metallo-beta-lactamase domain protein [Pleurostoma richardsiae]|uniref:Metallo-beta-lactamase domain protein n=1 Tax=Pleurostoma richardsiae TaxID=41990 RepID=A0AA38VJH6_9PEZI|nr:Metallo-beta-lactamase domain protein [Pleurostoma richardsiae]
MEIQFAVFTSKPIPALGSFPDPSSPDAGLWSPMSCTLVYTANAALLVDCPTSIAATEELASWVTKTLPVGCKLRHFITSHAHGDHFFGFPVLQDRFPGIKAVATQKVVEGVATQYGPALYDGMWKPLFPTSDKGTGLPDKKVEFESLPPGHEVDLDGHLVRVHDVPHGDTHANSFIHVPDLGLVVAGDIVYNGDCHQHLGEANTGTKRAQWLTALSQIGELEPKIVVPGHTFTPPSEPNDATALWMLESTKEYIKGFEEELGKARSAEDLFKRMRSRYPRWNLWILEWACNSGFSSR